MFFNREQSCPNCGTQNPRDAKFCKQCNTPLGGGKRTCGVCGTANPSDARFCQECGRPMDEAETPQIVNDRWATTEQDFAVRVETNDLPGLLKKGINVEAGTNAMLLENGANVGVVPPGSYLLDSFSQRFGNFFRGGMPKSLTALLVKVVPTDLVFDLQGLFTKDPLSVGVSVTLQVEVEEPGKFLVNMLRGRERMSVQTLQAYLEPEVEAVANRWLRTHTIDELTDDFSLSAKFELALEEALRQSFSQSGLRFLQVRALKVNLEVLDRINNKKSEYALLVSEDEADLQGRTPLYAVRHELDLQELARETASFEVEERKMALYQRMRLAVNSDKMDEVRTDADLRKFFDDMHWQEILDEKEREEILQAWAEEKKDHDRARRLLDAKLDGEVAFEINRIESNLIHQRKLTELNNRNDLSKAEKEHELEMAIREHDYAIAEARKIANARFDLEKEKGRHQVELQRLQLEQQTLVQEQRSLEANNTLKIAKDATDLALQILANKKALDRLDEEEKRRIAREDELTRAQANFDKLMQGREFDLREADAQRAHEIYKMETMATMTAEQLIALSPTEQGQILMELKRTEAMQSMSEEQILALAAQNSPEVAKAFQERYREMASSTVEAFQRERALYEERIKDQKDFLNEIQNLTEGRVKDIQDANRETRDLQKHALDSLSDTAKAFANNKASTPTIIFGEGGSRTIFSDGSQSQPEKKPADNEKTCVGCGRKIDISFKNCPHCGHKFADMA